MSPPQIVNVAAIHHPPHLKLSSLKTLKLTLSNSHLCFNVVPSRQSAQTHTAIRLRPTPPIGVLAHRLGGFLVIFYFVWSRLRKKIGDLGFFFFFLPVVDCWWWWWWWWLWVWLMVEVVVAGAVYVFWVVRYIILL